MEAMLTKVIDYACLLTQNQKDKLQTYTSSKKNKQQIYFDLY